MKRKWIVLGAIAVCVIFVIIAFLSLGSPFSKIEGIKTLKISVLDDDIRIGERVNFTVEGIEKGKNLGNVLLQMRH